MLNIRLLINTLRYLERIATEAPPESEADRPAPAGDAFELDVEPHKAIEAFHHPYSYAAFNDGVRHTLAV
jgi:hypothetical protein